MSKYEINAITGRLDKVSIEDLSGYLTLDQTTPQTVSGGSPIFGGGITTNSLYENDANKWIRYNLDTNIIYEDGLYLSADFDNRLLKNHATNSTFDWENLKFPTLTTNGFIKTSNGDGTLSVDTNTYLTVEADTLDTVADRGATTDQTLTAGGFTTTGTVTAQTVDAYTHGVKGDAPALATGGTITTDGDYTVHTFTSDGTFTPLTSMNVEYLVVAGGGGGGAGYYGGGGGAGGTIGNGAYDHAVTAQAYSVTVGDGGPGSTSISVRGTNGSNSVFDTVTSTGGGGGGSRTGSSGGTSNGAAGGSGGGASFRSSTGGAGTAGQGNNGGSTNAVGFGASGGGAGAVGVGGTQSTSCPGGIGVQNDISGTNTYYAGGGGGGKVSLVSPGGLGGGGAGG